MKIGHFALINTKGKVIVDVEKRVREIYINGGNEAAYLAYRTLMRVDVHESWRVVKKWIKVWERKKEGANA